MRASQVSSLFASGGDLSAYRGIAPCPPGTTNRPTLPVKLTFTILGFCCVTGFNGVAGFSCVACEVSKYKTATGTVSACTDCPGELILRQSYVFDPWPVFLATALTVTTSTGRPALSDCVCQPGYTGVGGSGTCAQCAFGTHKPLAGPQDCTDNQEGKPVLVCVRTRRRS